MAYTFLFVISQIPTLTLNLNLADITYTFSLLHFEFYQVIQNLRC
jgi:hypothetical protein